MRALRLGEPLTGQREKVKSADLPSYAWPKVSHPELRGKGYQKSDETPKAVGERRVHLPIDLMACCKEAKKGEAQVAKCGRAGSGRSHRADPEPCNPPVRS